MAPLVCTRLTFWLLQSISIRPGSLVGVVSVLGLEPTQLLVQDSAMRILSAQHLEVSVQTTSSVSLGAHILPFGMICLKCIRRLV